MRLRLIKLQKLDKKFKKPKKEYLNRFKNINRMLHHQKRSFVLEIIQIKLISKYHNNFLASYFSINKTKKLISRKYY